MKIIINTQFGSISNYAAIHRTDPELIAAVENGARQVPASICKNPNGTSTSWNIGNLECLKVVEIPADATDYYIDDYDGNERIICVINGKLHFIS